MELRILKYGNLMGSPDLKEMMRALEPDTKAADRLWDDLFRIKIAFGLNGQSTSALLLAPECPELFPALMDASWLCADPASYTDASVTAALDAINSAGVNPEEIRSHFVTHPHGDHLDPRLMQRLPNVRILAHPDSRIPGATPLTDDICPSGFIALNTPGHGTPHCSFIADISQHDLSVLMAGDLIMSHAHYLAIDHPKSFSDSEAGKDSVRRALQALAGRPAKYKMILPGHDIPFFMNP